MAMKYKLTKNIVLFGLDIQLCMSNRNGVWQSEIFFTENTIIT